ncbi:MAG TPA: Minf_1886 family protein [Planctomycetota bacterium]|nr:Minf_1886 family protein [Planctomycetota bacterium]
MSAQSNFEEKLKAVVASDPRFPVPAYRFIYEGLDYTVRNIGCKRHVTGRELAEGLRNLAIEQFGGLALLVLGQWNIRRTEDFGAMVFNLVDAGLMSRADSDSIEDFADVYDFGKTFSLDAKPTPIVASQ